MSNKKQNIDNLFRKELNGLEVNPPDTVWQAIESKRDKEPRNVNNNYLWHKIAAIFIVGLSLTLYFTNSYYTNSKEELKVTEQPSINYPIDKGLSPDNFNDDFNISITTSYDEVTDSDKRMKSNNNVRSENSRLNKTKTLQKTIDVIFEPKITNNSTENYTTNSNKSSIITKEINNQDSLSVINHRNNSNAFHLTNAKRTKDNTPLMNEDDSYVSNTSASKTKTSSNSSTTFNERSIREKQTPLSGVFLTMQDSKSILPLGKEYASVSSINSNLKETKWNFTPIATPIFSNQFSEASSIDSALDGLEVSNSTTYAYGVRVSYSINEKLTIQSGANRLSFDQTTPNVSIKQTLLISDQHSIVFSNNQTNVVFSDTQESLLPTINSNSLQNQSRLVQQGDLRQQFSYMEIPLEVKYKVNNSTTFGIHVVAGMSALFLNDNTIQIEGTEFTNFDGQASNLNDFNMSGNFGVDLEYQVAPSIFLNMTPMVKAQINTFSNTSGNVNPYYFGIYSGLSYRF